MPEFLLGDLNDNGVVDWADHDILVECILGYPISEISPLPEAEFLRRADINGDGAINVLDIAALMGIIGIQFELSSSHTAIVTMSNPTTKPFDYLAELYMGIDLALMASEDFHLEAEEAKDISLPVIMPNTPGTYPIHIGVFSGGQSIGLYRAIRDVIIVGLLGDLNDNGIVDEDDISVLQLYILNYPIPQISPLSEAEFLRRADVNGDGVINVLDMAAIAKIIMASTTVS